MSLQLRIDNFCKKLKPTNRNIFGAPDPEEVENLYQNEMNNERQLFEDSFPGMLKTIENMENHRNENRRVGKARRKLNVCLFGQPNPVEIYDMVKKVELEDKLKLREVYDFNLDIEEENRRQFRSSPCQNSKKRKRGSDEENSHPINKRSKRRLTFPSGDNRNNNNKIKRITDFFQQRKNGPLSENKSDVHKFN